MGVDVIDPADGNQVVLETRGEIQLGQFDLVFVDVVDAADMATVRADDFKAFTEQREVYHGALLTFVVSGEPVGREAGCIGGVMGEVVNLNRVRKSRAKAEKAAAASANRAAHGRTKPERARAETERARADRMLDGSKLED